MSVSKLLKRIVAPDLTSKQLENLDKNELGRDMHVRKIDKLPTIISSCIELNILFFFTQDYTHGINSDPMGVLAIIFSALIHDGMFSK